MGIQISLPMMAFLVFMTGFAGFVDSAAGGGGLISLPAYLFAGLPPHYTYATNKFSAACGTTFATASFFKNGAMNLKVGILAAIGSFAGSALGAHIVLMNKDFHDIIEYNDHPSMVYGARVSRMILDQILACEGELYK